LKDKPQQHEKTQEGKNLNHFQAFRQTAMVKFRDTRILDKVVASNASKKGKNEQVFLNRDFEIQKAEQTEGNNSKGHMNTAIDIKFENFF
ncbi:MAG: hypothetical protein WBL21_03965, partial [Salinimicrobium sp.]